MFNAVGPKMIAVGVVMMIIGIIFMIVGCGGAEPTPTPVPDRLDFRPTPVPTAMPTEVPTPVPTPVPTEVPTPMPTPVPTLAGSWRDLLGPQPTATPIPTPLPTPTLDRYAPIKVISRLPDVYRRTGITYTNGPKITNDVLQITAVFENMALEPTDIQIWQFPEGWRKSCPTDKPIAFISPERSGFESYPYDVCVYANAQYARAGIQVPWVEIDTWSYVKRFKGTSVRDEHLPTYWDWRVTVDIGDSDVYKLEFTEPIGYMVIVYSGVTLLAKEWIDY